MPDVCLIFEVHQPMRLNRNFHHDLLTHNNVTKRDLFNLYFDHSLNRHVLDRVAKKCYFPANNIILEQIDAYKKTEKPFKVAYSLSGVFVEQCERWNRDVLESFRQLAESGCVEFLEQPYYHSLSSLYAPEWSEFIEQVEMHRRLMKDLFDCEPRVLENTECLYNNAIAKTVKEMGYKAMVTEGAERILKWKSPNYVYKAKGCDLLLLLRNYRLSDDIGFRFSSTWWDQWPLTAPKYASWLSTTPGHVVVIFLDYETFGEHHWPESGIHDFLRALPEEVSKHENLRWSTPSEIIRRYKPVGEIDVPEYNTISWADEERDVSAWIGNSMQQFCYNSLRQLEPLVKGIGDLDLLRLWRYLQMSDHLYYMSTKGGGPEHVHSYFSPYNSPIEAFVVYSRILSDLEARVQLKVEKLELTVKRVLLPVPIEKGFTFFYDFARPTKWTARSLKEFHSILKVVDLKSIQFHTERGDFERWIRHVIGDQELANEIAKISKEGPTGKDLRSRILAATERRIKEVETKIKPVKANINCKSCTCKSKLQGKNMKNAGVICSVNSP